MSDETMLRFAQQRCGAMRMQSNADDSDASSGAQIKRCDQLTSEDHGRLAISRAICVYALERIAKMENDLGTPVWQHRLRTGHFARVSIERPHTLHDPHEWRRGQKFPVLHR